MKLTFSVKALGKKRPYIDQQEIELDLPSATTTKDLLMKIVEQQVAAFDQRKKQENLILFLSDDAISAQAQAGNVKFNAQYNSTPADHNKAVEVVLQAFEDGLFALFVNDEQRESLPSPLTLNEFDTISIVRLTFLAGSIW